jgi:predicted lipid-binding transport protein (Tim44 family)
MVRSLVGFAGVAVVALLALKLLSGLFGFAISLFMMLLWLAFWGFVIYLVLRVFAPGLADRVREFVRGSKPANS